MKADLEYLENAVNEHLKCNYALIALCKLVLRDTRFAEAPGGIEHHHQYAEGLTTHVAEVMNNVIKLSGGHPSPVLIVSVIWHDYMKIRDYAIKNGQLVGEPYKKLICHVAGSFAEFYHTAKNMDLPEEFIDEVSHCLLSHHGRKEWGSPVEPQTPDAIILHTADHMSAHGVILCGCIGKQGDSCYEPSMPRSSDRE